MKPVFAKGVGAQGQLSQGAAQGDTVLRVAGADQAFSVGDLVFCSEADGTETEYLGPASAVGGASVTAAFALAAAKSAGAPVWRPAARMVWPVGRSAPLLRVYDSGVEVQRTVSGALYHTRLREPYREETLVFDNLPRAAFDAYSDWFINTLGDGAEAFTFVDEERAVWTVKVMDTQLEQRESPAGVARVAVRLAVVE